MLRYHDVMFLFADMRKAITEKRDLTDVEILETIRDAQKVLASIIDSLNKIAERGE